LKKKSKWKSNGRIIGSKAKSCCNGLFIMECNTTFWMIRKMIDEAIYIRVSDRK
jgi:hypothetical protein